MAISARIYAGNSLGFGGWPAINDLLFAKYNAVIVWSVHVDTDGTLYLNDSKIVAAGTYVGAFPFNLPARLARLRQAGTEIIFSVGAAGTHDFANIGNLLGNQPGDEGNPVYDNFKALKQAMIDAGGDIDAIDFDNEDYLNADVMANFGKTLSKISYKHVTFCPFDYPNHGRIWAETMNLLVRAPGAPSPDFVNAIHLQVYSGGSPNINKVDAWKTLFKAAGGNALMIPGLAAARPEDGPWWAYGKMGETVVPAPKVAMSEAANWDNYLYTWNFATVEEALQGAQTAASFFFYCRGPFTLDNGCSFQTGDAVYFTGKPTWRLAEQCDAYYLGGRCVNDNPLTNACPSDLRTQFLKWGTSIDGGFIWGYDSIVGTLLTQCCGGSINNPVATALAYRRSITG